MLTVYIDFKSAASYLGLNPIRQLAEDLGIEVCWQPYRSAERPVPTEVADRSVTGSHRNARARSLRAAHEHYGALQGLEMHWRDTPGITDLALGVLATAGGNLLPFINAAFKAYWVDGHDLNDESVVRGLLEVAGLEFTVSVPELRNAVADAELAAEEVGVVGVPAMVVSGQVFVGREHLPWIKELLIQEQSPLN